MSRVIINGYVVGMIQTNVWYLHREGNPETVVIDPADQGDALYEAIEGQGLKIRYIFLTHAHFDHIAGAPALIKRSGARLYAGELEKRLCSDTKANLSEEYGRPTTVSPDRWLSDGEVIDACGITFHVILTPGHTEGSCCYYIEGHDSNGSKGGTEEEPMLIAGDTLFQGSYGRTDMATGSEEDIYHSIKEKLFLLPDDTRVFPGHGGTTQIGWEKRNNIINV